MLAMGSTVFFGAALLLGTKEQGYAISPTLLASCYAWRVFFFFFSLLVGVPSCLGRAKCFHCEISLFNSSSLFARIGVSFNSSYIH